MISPLTEAMATSATGYAAVIDGVLDIRTVSDGPNTAIRIALGTLGTYTVGGCRNPGCDCMVKLLPKLTDRVKIVPVSVTVT